MTGARLTAEFDDGKFKEALVELQARMSDLSPLLKNIGTDLVETTRARFVSAMDPENRPWPGLKPAYAAFKQGPGILREQGMRDGLMGSIKYEVQGPRQVAIGSGKKYAAVHQFGRVIRPVFAKALVFRLGKKVIHAKSVVIPARTYLGFGPADQDAALAAVKFYLEETFKDA